MLQAEELLVKFSEGAEYAAMLGKVAVAYERCDEKDKALQYVERAADATLKLHGLRA